MNVLELIAARVAENEARIRAGTGSPKILLGGINLGCFPNFHALPMLEMGASVVSISHEEKPGRVDHLHCGLQENLAAVLHRLPPKWQPDFFLDLQAEHGHWLPIGLAEVPFPTVITVNHAHLGQVLWHARGLFDRMVMPSMMMQPWGEWLPWAGSWGTMDERISMRDALYDGEKKTVTVACPMSTNGAARESVRHSVIAEMRRLKKARKDWTIEVATGLEQGEYFRLLARSSVVVNVGTWGSPVSYRPLEAVAQGAILVHLDETAYGSTAKMGDVFEPHWYVAATPETLERSIEKALSMAPTAPAIKAEVDARYSYKAQFQRLFALAMSTKMRERMPLRDWSRKAYAIGHLTGFEGESAMHGWALYPHDLDVRPGFRHSVNLWQPADPEARYRFQTELALGRDPKETYERYACAR